MALAGKPFEKGKSGNPGGKPSFVRACEAAGVDPKKLSGELVEKLVEGMRTLDRTSASWRFCLEQLLHYRLGKPKDTVVHEFNGEGESERDVADMTDEELDALIAEGEEAEAELAALEHQGDDHETAAS